MVRGSDPRKVDEWTQRLGRFRQSHQSVAQFCQSEGVSTASFYQWQRKLRTYSAASGQDGLPSSAKNRAAFQRVQVTLGQPPAVTVSLPGGIAVEVASDPVAIGAVMRQLLAAEVAAGGRARC